MKYNIEITFSKIMALLILIIGASVSIILNDSSIILLSIPISGSVIVNKQVNDRYKTKYKDEN